MKNIEGESGKEVRKRMLCFLENILENYKGKNIVVVSHGAAIKFLLQKWCTYDYNQNVFLKDGKIICETKLESPSVLKFTFNNKELKTIEKLKQR